METLKRFPVTVSVLLGLVAIFASVVTLAFKSHEQIQVIAQQTVKNHEASDITRSHPEIYRHFVCQSTYAGDMATIKSDLKQIKELLKK